MTTYEDTASAPGPIPVRPSEGLEHDLRMLPFAVAGWVGSWLGTGAGTGLLGLGAVGGTALAVTAVLRRSWWMAGVALMLLLAMVVGLVQQHRLVSGPISELAKSGAIVDAVLVLRSDPQVHPAAVRCRPS